MNKRAHWRGCLCALIIRVPVCMRTMRRYFMSGFFKSVDKIKPIFDITYKVVLFVCKLLLIADIFITTMSVIGRYVPFIPDPAWSEEVVLTCMAYMAVLSAALAIRRGPISG